MTNHIWSVLCSRAVIDQETNNVSIQNVIEQLQIKAKPEDLECSKKIAIELMLISFWTRSDPDKPERHNTRMIFCGPDDEIKLGPIEFEVDLTEKTRFRTKGRVYGLPLEGSGTYSFRVETQTENLKWHEVARIPLEIIITEIGSE